MATYYADIDVMMEANISVDVAKIYMKRDPTNEEVLSKLSTANAYMANCIDQKKLEEFIRNNLVDFAEYCNLFVNKALITAQMNVKVTTYMIAKLHGNFEDRFNAFPSIGGIENLKSKLEAEKIRVEVCMEMQKLLETRMNVEDIKGIQSLVHTFNAMFS